MSAVLNAEKGLVDAQLGSHIVKQRIARPGEGKSGGYRTLIYFRTEDISIFLFGYAKNDRSNLSQTELKMLRVLAAAYDAAESKSLVQSLLDQGHVEVPYNENDI